MVDEKVENKQELQQTILLNNEQKLQQSRLSSSDNFAKVS